MNDPSLDLRKLPSLSQRQDSSLEQLEDLAVVANRLGMYDAYDWLVRHTSAAGARINARQNECTCGVGGVRPQRALQALRGLRRRRGLVAIDTSDFRLGGDFEYRA